MMLYGLYPFDDEIFFPDRICYYRFSKMPQNLDPTCFDQQLLNHIYMKENYEANKIINKQYKLDDVVNSIGETLLHIAVKCDNPELTQDLVHMKYNVNITNKLGETPIILTLKQNEIRFREKMLKILIFANSDIYKCDNHGKSALEIVLNYPDYISDYMIKLFLQKVQSDHNNDNVLIAQRLLEAKCPLEKVIYLNNAKLTKIMIDCGCSVHTRHPKWKTTALHKAVELMDHDNVDLLIKRGANVNAKNLDGERPLGFFCSYDSDNSNQNPEIIKKLISKGAVITKCRKGLLPIDSILRYGTKESLQVLLQYRINLDSKNDPLSNGGTMLHILACNTNPDITCALEGKTFNVDALDKSGYTPLFKTISSNNKTTVKYLVEKGSNVNAKNRFGNTPLMTACMDVNQKSIVDILVNNGADIQCITSDQKTIFDIIIEDDTFILAKPLLAHIAIYKELEKPIAQVIQNQIKTCEMFENYFSWCQKRIEKMKNTIFYGNVTLFTLLVENKERLAKRCVRSNVLLKKLKNINKKCHSNFYYFGILRKRTNEIVINVQNCEFVLSRLMTQPTNVSHVVVHKVFDFLDYKDLSNLNKVYELI